LRSSDTKTCPFFPVVPVIGGFPVLTEIPKGTGLPGTMISRNLTIIAILLPPSPLVGEMALGFGTSTGTWIYSVSRMIEREQTMRRLLFSLLAMSLMGVFVGCRATHGVCDCGCDFDDPCAYRAPWANEGETKSPEMRESLPTPPKKL
jgi:hypothetical protein